MLWTHEHLATMKSYASLWKHATLLQNYFAYSSENHFVVCPPMFLTGTDSSVQVP